MTHLCSAYGSELKEKRPYPPCRAACPIHIDTQAYVALIAQSKYEEAFEVIRSVNPIASTCSVICYHPCEQACRRIEIDEPIAIRHLKRFAMEKAIDYRQSQRRRIPQTRKEKIAIIGSGPSGLTAANDLADLGYKVTIFEKFHEPGGMLVSAIPPYRLPRQILKDDIDDILAKGVEMKTGFEVGRDMSFNDLANQYDAVLIAAGLSQSLSLSVPGIEGPGVLLALPFLEDIACAKKPPLGKRVLIIGGGNVAVDVARCVRRLGDEDIQLVCLESPDQMPAWKWELDETAEEGIRFNHQRGAKAIVRSSNGRIEGLETVKVTSLFDEHGRFNPVFDEAQSLFIPADTIIIAIGRRSDFSFLKDTPVKLNERGLLIWNKNTHQTSLDKVFASGEAITGPCPAIRAVADGRRAGKAIHQYLRGEDIQSVLDEHEKNQIRRLPEDVRAKIATQARERIEVLAPEIRITGFDQYEIGYDEASAVKESRRCRSCGAGAVADQGKCCGCLTCFRICPYGTPVVTHRANMLVEKCQACGLCASECPNKAISMVGYDVDGLIKQMPAIIGTPDPERKSPILVAFHCNYHAGFREISLPSNIRPMIVHCASRIGVRDLLKAFECGADGAYIVLGSESVCKYKNITPKVKARIEHVRHLLEEIGLDKERLRWFEAGGHPEEVWRKAAEEMSSAIKPRKSDFK
jgi:NADPH-dependent glutamate synthase beta subunit-like oxidoreductase/coenzyme F420-reducing hydrogenase delta subunit/Pyruvate/2-oxoacid:ferredoxin oxidoreductase delta subunit